MAMESKKEMKGWVPEETLREIDNAMEEFKKNFLSQWLPMKGKAIHSMLKGPRIDLNDMGDHYDVFVEVPGAQKEAVQVHMTKGAVEVSAEVEEESVDTEKCIIHERNHEGVYRSVTFPEEIIPEEAEATVANGLLKIVVPKRHKPEAKHRVEVK